MIRIFALALLAVVWTSAACAADKDDARVAIAQAQAAVQAAENADAATAASTEMRAAKDNLTAAHGASDRRQWDDSILNAQKATADANLASARARQQRATSATKEIEASLESLRQQATPTGS
ncbi:MAG: DUF4398 domain-containing protein [Rhodanobacteraceae bacterium]